MTLIFPNEEAREAFHRRNAEELEAWRATHVPSVFRDRLGVLLVWLCSKMIRPIVRSSFLYAMAVATEDAEREARKAAGYDTPKR